MLPLADPSASGLGAKMAEPRRHAFSLADELAALPPAIDWLRAVLASHAVPSDTAFRLELCVHEALENVLRHGHEAGAPREIELTVEVFPGHAVARICDDGGPFDPLSAPLPPKPATLDSAMIGGLGLRLLREFASECHYIRDGGKNVLTIVARRAA